MSALRQQYANPPIEEAICEFRFTPGNWNVVTAPAEMYSRLSATYSGEPRYQTRFATQVLQSPNVPAISMAPASMVLQFLSADQKRLLGVAPDTLSIHDLKPYTDWEGFRPRIEQGFEVFRSITEPLSLNRIGLRYVNKISIPSSAEPVDLSVYFQGLLPRYAPGMPRNIGTFLHRVEHLYDDGIRLLTTFSALGDEGERSSYLLDLDIIWEGQPAATLAEVMSLVDDLRARERIAFEAAITDQLRRQFDAG